MKVIYPGTFDPITFGHVDIIKRSVTIFDEVIVAIAENNDKGPLFSVEERCNMIKESTADLENVTVVSFSNLLVDFASGMGVSNIIRGVRAISDFEYEFQMALTNRKISEDINTIFMMPHEKYSYINSRTIKEICKLGGDVSSFVPACVEKNLKNKL